MLYCLHNATDTVIGMNLAEIALRFVIILLVILLNLFAGLL